MTPKEYECYIELLEDLTYWTLRRFEDADDEEALTNQLRAIADLRRLSHLPASAALSKWILERPINKPLSESDQ